MRSVQVQDLEHEKCEAIRNDRPVILFGSFLSTYKETSLRSGEEISKFIYELLFKDLDSKYKGWFQKDFERVPFEALMECYPYANQLPEALTKLYGSNTTNPVYAALVQAARTGGVAAFITTNYDCALEGALTEGDSIHSIRNEKEWETWKREVGGVPYLKIHGSAEPEYQRSLVFDLRREGRLDPWKCEAIRTVLSNRHLIILGFSGRDFDVCPQLTETGLRDLYWLQPSKEGLSANAQRVIQTCNGCLVVGDLLQFLTKFLNRPVNAEPPNHGDLPFLDIFQPDCFDVWRFRILDRMGCRNIAEPLLARLELACDKSDLATYKIACARHAGRYKKIIEIASLAAALEKDIAVAVRWHLEESFGWLTYGRLNLSQRSLERAMDLLGRISIEADAGKLKQDILQSRLTLLMRRAQIARMTLRSRRYVELRQEADKIMRQLHDELTRVGELDARQAAYHNGERLGLGKGMSWPLPSEAGYAALGLRCMECISARDWIRARPWWLSRKRARAAAYWVTVAEAYGWHHEAWKLRWILFWRCPLNLRSWDPIKVFRHLNRTMWHFRRVEYTLLWRFYQLVSSVIPTDHVSSFDADLLAKETPTEYHSEPQNLILRRFSAL